MALGDIGGSDLESRHDWDLRCIASGYRRSTEGIGSRVGYLDAMWATAAAWHKAGSKLVHCLAQRPDVIDYPSCRLINGITALVYLTPKYLVQ